MAGISTAIITIRGMDLFSKPIQAAARGAQADIARLEISINRVSARAQMARMDAAKLATLPTTPARTAKIADLGAKATVLESAASMKTAEAAALRYGSSLDVLRGKMAQFAGQLSSMGLMMTATMTLPIVAAGAAIVNASLKYEESMRNIQSISRGTDADTAALGARFIALSTDITKTVASPLELADAFYEIQSAAFYGAEAQKILEQTTKTATAGLADQKETAKATAMALHAYGVGAEEVTHYTDVMMRAVDIGIFRFEDLTQQMGDFIAAAGMLGVPIEQAMAALTTMTKKGLPIDEAATSLNRLFTSFLKPSAKAEEAAASFGIELSASHLKAVGFANAMREVMHKTGGAEGALAAIFPEMRSLRGIFALGSDDLRMFNYDLTQMESAAGTVNTVFNTQIQAWSAQLKNFKNNIQALALSFGNVLMPIMTAFLRDNITPLTVKLRLLNDETKSTILRVAALTAVAGPLAIVIGQVINATSAILGVFNGLGRVIAPIAGLLKVFGLSFTPIVVGIAAVIAALAAFSAAFILWNTNALGFGAKLEALAAESGPLGSFAYGLTNIFKAIKDSNLLDLNTELNALKLAFSSFGTELTTMFAAVGMKLPTIDEVIQVVIKGIALLIVDVIQLSSQFLLVMAVGIETFTSLLAPIFAVGLAIADVLALAGILVQEFIALAKGDLSKALEFDIKGTAKVAALKDSITSIPQVIKDSGERLKSLPAIYNPIFEQIATDAQKAKDKINKVDLFKQPFGPNGPFPAGFNPNPNPGDPFAVDRSGKRQVMGVDIPYPKRILDGVKAPLKDMANTPLIDTKNLDTAKSKLDAMATKLSSMADEAVTFSKNLGNLPGTPENPNPLAPGNPNGPFEAMYRIKDIAMSGGPRGKGVDTDKWMEMYKMGPEQAAELVKKFEANWADPAVQPYIDWTKLIDQVKLDAAAKASQEALVASIAKNSGLGKEALAALLGMGKDEKGNTTTPTIDAAAIQTGIKTSVDALPKDGTILNTLIGAGSTSTFDVVGMRNALKEQVLTLPPDGSLLNALIGIGKDKEGKSILPSFDVGAIKSGFKAQIDALPKDAAVAQSLIGIDSETAKTAANNTIGILLPAFDTSISDNAEMIAERGAAYWGKFEGGLISAAESSGALYSAVEAMVLKSLGVK